MIQIKDFVPMAQHIAASVETPFDIPTPILKALNRLIWVRKTFATKMGASRNKQADATHAHFVDVLERVQEILKPLLGPIP